MALAQQPQGSASTPAAAAAAGAAAAQDPASYDKLREAFIRDLRHFHDTRGTSFKHKPRINGKEVDLFKLYTVVTSRGGWVQVNNKNEWSWICEEFHLPSGCVNSSVGLKQIYLRYLDRYEKVHFLGEDGNQGDADDDDSRHRKWNVKSLHSVPLTYNHHQHNVAESLREYNGLSSNLYKPSNYDKLALSLLSPLPNEQDFAINVCTFLSNEGKHTLRLDKYPRLINHLLAHAGVFDAPGTRQLFIESYSKVRNYSINSFWQDVLDAPDVLDLTDERAFIVAAQKAAAASKFGKRKNSQQQQSFDGAGASKAKTTELQADGVGLECPMDMDIMTPPNYDKPDNGVDILVDRLAAPELFIDEASCSSSVSSGFKDQNQNSIKFEEDDKDLFCVGRTLGTQDPYGQRVLQIASILRNLSFTPENAVILGRSPNFLRFVLLCTRARWSNLHQLGFDTLGNIANEIVLKEIGQRLTKVVLECVSKGISSQDRFVVISCLEVLNKISQQDLNEETLTLGLDDSVYELICRFLALSDIALLVHTLECLYALTSLGERPCNSVARVRGAIDTLVALVTVEAQSYGPKACILMRVVETVSSIPASQQQQQQQSHQQTSDVQHQSQSQLPAQSSPQQQHHQHHHSQQHHHHHSQHHQQTGGEPSSAGFANWLKMKNSPLHQSSAPSTGAPTATNVQIPGTTSQGSGTHASPSPSIHKQQTQHQIQTQILQAQAQQAQSHQAQTHQAQSQPTIQAQTLTQPVQQAQVQQPPTMSKAVTANSGGGSSRPSTPKSSAKAANSLQQQHAHQQIIQENEQFALSWLKSNFELSPGVKIEQEELYKKYLGSCTKIGRRGVIAPLHFPRCVRSVFGGTIGPNPVKGDSSGALYYEGIRVRATPVQVMTPAQNVVSSTSANPQASSGDGSTSGPSPGAMVQQAHQRSIDSLAHSPTPSSPILKAQLSAPPRQPVLSPINTLKSPSPVTGETKSQQVSVAHPHLSHALLSSGAQQQQQQQAPGSPGQPQMQTVQVIMRDDGKGGTTSSSIIKSLLATKVTVGGECMQAAAAPTASVSAITNVVQVASSVSANQLVTASQVAQRQQQQQQQRQQQIQSQLITSGVQSGTVPVKTFVKAKTKQIITVKKVQRLNGAKIIIPNNCEKTEPMDTDSTSQPAQLPSFAIGDVNHRQQHVTLGSPSPTNAPGKPQRNASTPTVEDSDSTNNSLASSSGIGGSRDCSGMGAEEDNSLTSFEGLLNGAPSNTDIEAQEDGSSKDSSSAGSKDKVPMQSIMLADLLEKKADKEPMVNGILGKKDLVENHIKKALKEEPPDDTKVKVESVSVGAVEVPQVAGIKRSISTSDEPVEAKKAKYANGTSSPDPSAPSQQVKIEEIGEEKEEKVTVSSTAANLYAALAADIINEVDLEETLTPEDVKPAVKEEVVVKEESSTPVSQVGQESQPAQQQVQAQQAQQQGTHQVAMTQQQLQQQIQQGLIVAGAPRQIVVAQQAIQSNNQIVIHPGQVKNAAVATRPASQTQQVLQVQQNSGGQTHYVISGGIPGQNYVLAQPQTALVQGQAQTVLVAQQQGTNAKTIIILQPQSAAQQQTQKVLAMTPQGQQVVVTQVQRQLLQGSAVAGSAPPPLVSSTANAPAQTAVVANNTAVQQQTQSVPSNPVQVVQTQQQASAVPSRVATPTPTTTPPPSRPMTPQQPVLVGASKPIQNPVLVKDTKDIKVVTTTSTDAEKDGKSGGLKKPSTTQHDTQSSVTSSATASRSQTPTTSGTPASTAVGNVPKTITIKYDPNSFLCEWRGCLRQFKTPRKVFLHACEAHCPTGSEEVICLWASCDTLKRRRFSLMAHLSDKHCCDEEMFKRRKQLATSGKTEIATTTTPTPTAHHPGYAPNAAFHAIKRHALEFVNPKELMDDNEGPVTKSIRLTAALILRNLVIYSAHGRRHLRAYEPHLAGVALSNVESSRTIAQVLYDMNDQSSSGHR